MLTKQMLVVSKFRVNSGSLYDNLPLNTRLKLQMIGIGSAFRTKPKRVDRSGQYFSLFGPWSSNYYHWLTEVVPKFFLFESEIRKGTILIPAIRPRVVDDFLKIFEFNNVLEVNENLRFERLSLITNPFTNHYDRDHLHMIRERLINAIPNELDSPSRIYVSRRNSRSRKVVNEDEVIISLKKLGFAAVELDNASLTQQIKLFRNCEILVSIHGAALANSVLMPKGSKVIELYPKLVITETDPITCFRRACNLLEIEHHFLFCRSASDGQAHKLDIDDLLVSPDELNEWINP